MGEKTIYELELHETFIDGDFAVTRVPGGWLYRYWDFEKKDYYDSVTFVPFHNEFQESK